MRVFQELYVHIKTIHSSAQSIDHDIDLSSLDPNSQFQFSAAVKMDMPGMTMTSSATSTASAAVTSMTGMSMGGGDCKISVWNLLNIGLSRVRTHDLLTRCFGIGTRSTHVYCSNLASMKAPTNGPGFIASTWHITSHGMFAGSCVGVILLVILLEFLRRLSKEYDRFILQQFRRRTAMAASYSQARNAECCAPLNLNNDTIKQCGVEPVGTASIAPTLCFRPTVVQQSIRALLHMASFAVAYFVMLLAMYFNGYLIICIFIGAYLGAFIFSWESVTVVAG